MERYRQKLEYLFSGLRVKYQGEIYIVGGWGGSTESGMWTRLWIAPGNVVPAAKCIPLGGIDCARWRRQVKANAFMVFDPGGNIIGIGQHYFCQKARFAADNILADWAEQYRAAI
jgi:hypothetical protein|tara:strand:+ start:339 stop:683 length:345 start_codon:yes stop_codon:yes gene_type:complete